MLHVGQLTKMLDDQQVINQQLKEEMEVRLCNSLETIHLCWKLDSILFLLQFFLLKSNSLKMALVLSGFCIESKINAFVFYN